jgi:hypothetical protein
LAVDDLVAAAAAGPAYRRCLAVATRAETETEVTEQTAEVETSKQIVMRIVGHPLEPADIVFCAFSGIGEYRVGGGNAFESFLGCGGVVAVRVPFYGQPPLGVLDRFQVCIPRYAQFLVVVLVFIVHLRASG